jgi:hypothetical protein
MLSDVDILWRCVGLLIVARVLLVRDCAWQREGRLLKPFGMCLWVSKVEGGVV